MYAPNNKATKVKTEKGEINKSQLQLEILTILLQKLIGQLDRKSAISVDTEKAFDKM